MCSPWPVRFVRPNSKPSKTCSPSPLWRFDTWACLIGWYWCVTSFSTNERRACHDSWACTQFLMKSHYFGPISIPLNPPGSFPTKLYEFYIVEADSQIKLNITQPLGCCTPSTSNFVGIIPRLMLGHFCKMNSIQLEYCSYCKGLIEMWTSVTVINILFSLHYFIIMSISHVGWTSLM